MNWISVEDKLPKVNGTYIIYAPDGNSAYGEGIWYENIVVLAEYAFGSWWWRENSDDFDITDLVTHWMPLPESPQMEEE